MCMRSDRKSKFSWENHQFHLKCDGVCGASDIDTHTHLKHLVVGAEKKCKLKANSQNLPAFAGLRERVEGKKRNQK